MLSFLNNLSVRGKALAAFGALLMCMLELGAAAVVTVDRSSDGLRSLSSVTLPKQNVVEELNQDLTSVHVSMFRYFGLASSSMSESVLQPVRDKILAKADEVAEGIALFSRRADLTDHERAVAAGMPIKWAKYAKALKDMVDRGALDAPMAGMLLGAADDDFQGVASELRRISAMVVSETVALTRRLGAEAASNMKLLMFGALVGVLASLGIAILVARSLVEPIRAVTRALTALSAGRRDVELYVDPRPDEIGAMVTAIAVFREKLERDNRILNERENELRTQNLRFDTALANMSQGLAMFDKDRKLIVANRRYCEVYRLSPELAVPGTTQKEILQYRIAAGAYPGEAQTYIADRVANASEAKASDSVLELRDGRSVAVCHRAMDDGGWVSTHEDITERRRPRLRSSTWRATTRSRTCPTASSSGKR